MKIKALIILSAFLLVAKLGMSQRTGVNTTTPATTLHVVPFGGDEPAKFDGLISYSPGDTNLLVVDPANGIVRYMSIGAISNLIRYDSRRIVNIVSGRTDSLFTQSSFIDSLTSVIYRNGDTLTQNSEFMDTMYYNIMTDLMNDTNFINGMNDSIDDQNLIGMDLQGTTITTHIEDGSSASTNLIGLASDTSFTNTLATDSNFVSVLGTNSNFTTILGTDSTFLDVLSQDTTLANGIADSLLTDETFITAMNDSIDDQNLDSIKLQGTVITAHIEDGNAASANLVGLASNDEFIDSLLATKRFYQGTMIGDVKYGLQPMDHRGWIKLDGRSVDSLTPAQKLAAISLGFDSLLPNATGTYLSQNGDSMASISGSNTTVISQANLPNVTFNGTTNVAGNHSHGNNTNNSNGGRGLVRVSSGGNNTSTNNDSSPGEPNVVTRPDRLQIYSSGNHSHTVTVSSGGSATPMNTAPRTMSSTMFIYLGVH